MKLRSSTAEFLAHQNQGVNRFQQTISNVSVLSDHQPIQISQVSQVRQAGRASQVGQVGQLQIINSNPPIQVNLKSKSGPCHILSPVAVRYTLSYFL